MFPCRFLSPLAASALLVLIGAVAMAQSQSPLPPPVDRTQSTEARKREQIEASGKTASTARKRVYRSLGRLPTV